MGLELRQIEEKNVKCPLTLYIDYQVQQKVWGNYYCWK